jgi:hypothetical protein
MSVRIQIEIPKCYDDTTMLLYTMLDFLDAFEIPICDIVQLASYSPHHP